MTFLLILMIMKRSKLLDVLLLIFPIVMPFIVSAIAPIKTFVTSGVYGGYKTYESDPTITITISWNNDDDKAYEQIRCGSSSTNIKYIHTSEVYSVSKSKKYTRTFTLPTSQYLSTNGMYVSFSLFSKSLETAQYSANFFFYPYSSGNYHCMDYIDSYLTFKPTQFSFQGTIGVSVTSERLNFSGYVNYFIVDNYLNLPLAQFDFTWIYSGALSYTKAYMKFYDGDNIFKYLPHTIGYVEVPITLSKNSNKISLNFAKTMYVFPKTLEMSLDPLPGFKETNDFYLPVNKKDQVALIDFSFYFEGFGGSKSNYHFAINYDCDQSLLGPCHSSDYCVVGGIR